MKPRNDQIEIPIRVIGGGNMARAIIEGSIRAGVTSPATWVVAEPDADKRRHFEEMGISAQASLGQLGLDRESNGQCLLAVKPQSLQEVQIEAASSRYAGVVMSIVAGSPSNRIRDVFGGAARVVRVMPNTPAAIGIGMTAIAPGSGCGAEDDSVASRLFGSIGRVARIDEGLMDAFTGVAGSGPAYLFLLAEAMISGAVDAGLDEELAGVTVIQTILGAAHLMSDGPRGPEELRKAVTSRGGTTEAALDVLEAAGVKADIRRAIVAARDRGRELAGESRLGREPGT